MGPYKSINVKYKVQGPMRIIITEYYLDEEVFPLKVHTLT